MKEPHRRTVFISLPLALASMVVCNGCSLLPRFHSRLPGNRAFIAYWPPPSDHQGLRLAVKDNIDMKGVVTTSGSELFAKTRAPASEDAPCLAIARQRGVQIVGKANLTEFAVAPSGVNEFFGTPRNPLDDIWKLIPGGSSSGSAVAVASKLADVAFGTDTAGSIRVPAACCGVVGLKTTHGLVPIDGVHPIEAEHLDTVGPMARDIEHTVQGMDLLQKGFAAKYAAAKAAKPFARAIRVGRLKLNGTDRRIDEAVDHALAKTGFQIVTLDDEFRKKWERAKQDGNTVAAAGAWITDKRYRFSPRIAARTKSAILAGRIAYGTKYRGALARRHEWQQALADVFEQVDIIAVPTLQRPPAGVPLNLKIGLLEALMLRWQNTVPVNLAGNPALAVPIPVHAANVEFTSLQLIGPRLSEAELLNAGRLVEEAVKHEPTDPIHLLF